MDSRWMLGALVAMTGCVGLNPDYAAGRETEGTSGEVPPTATTKDGSSTDRSSGTSNGVDTTTELDPSGEVSTATDTGSPSETTGPKFDLGDTTGGETSTDHVNVVWLSSLVLGSFATNANAPCATPPGGTTCIEGPVMVVGTTEVPLSNLTDVHGFLGEGQLYAAGSAAVIAEGYGSLLDRVVLDDFVTALATDAQQAELQLWWGPETTNEPASCEDWTSPKGTAATAWITAGNGAMQVENAQCSIPRFVLCDCWGTP